MRQEVYSEAEGRNAVADISLCKTVYEILEEFYPSHGWMVGANHDAGIVTIDLPYEKPIHLGNWGYLLHITSVDNAQAKQKIMLAGGELLERFGLARAGATNDSLLIAQSNGLDTANAIGKSRH